VSFSVGAARDGSGQRWIIVYAEDPGTLAPGDPGRYAYVPIDPASAAAWVTGRPGAPWRSLEALRSVGAVASSPILDVVAPTLLEVPPFLGGSVTWFSPGTTRVTFQVDGGAASGALVALVLLLDGVFEQVGLSRNDRPASEARTLPMSVLFL
jgi:hypothetical protein